MNELQHTPGPWTLTTWSFNPGKGMPATIYGGKDGMDEVAICQFDREPDSPMAAEADALLIVAAPEMLEALKATIGVLEMHSDPASNELWGRVSAAYRKAIGVEEVV